MDGLITVADMTLPEMGRHAAFVWVAFGLSIGVLAALALLSLRALRAKQALLARLSGGGDGATPGRPR